MPPDIITSKDIRKIKPYKLSEREKLVLYALIRWPSSSDVEASEKIGLKRSTFTAIKKRLKDKNIYRVKYRLSLKYIDNEIIKCTFFEINPNIDEELLEEFSKAVFKSYSSSVYNIITDSVYIGFNFVKDFAKLKKGRFKFEERWLKKKIFTKEYPKYVTFSNKHSRIMFDYAPLIKHIFHLDIDNDEENDSLEKYRIEDKKIVKAKLNRNEKAAIHYMLLNPDKDDIFLSKQAGMNIQTFNKAKRRVLDRGIIRPIIIPMHKTLENELIVFKHFRFNQTLTFEERFEFLRYMDKKHPHHFMRIYDENECIFISVYRNYPIYHKNLKKIEEYVAKNSITSHKPTIAAVPIKNIIYLKNVVFSGLYRKMSETDEENI
ncbi:MAG: hypothetical protein KAJ88_03250 [Candidatus Aenigmarchaeota archaeon]|nr:hypothetical protein [Candidatus Aenigmarchaeota archaeon]